jgi:DNA-binding response OmpR family regulator
MARVYVADDNADVRHVVIYSLTDHGHDVTMLKDGEATLDALLTEPPDLLILDIMMPGFDGFEILEQMSSWGLKDGTRTIVLTARASEDDRRRAFDAGADCYVTKPFDPEELATTAEQLLSLSGDELRAWRALRVGVSGAGNEAPA